MKTFQRWFEIKFVALDRVMKFIVGHSEKYRSNQISCMSRLNSQKFQNFHFPTEIVILE